MSSALTAFLYFLGMIFEAPPSAYWTNKTLFDSGYQY